MRDLEEKVEARDDEILDLRANLRSSQNAKERFKSNSDLADVAVRETQVLAAKTIIEGLKPELGALPDLKKGQVTLDGKLTALGDLPGMVTALGGLPTLLASLAGLPQKMAELKEALMASDEKFQNAEDARATDVETILGHHSRLSKVLGQFGLSSSSSGLDIPKTLSLVLSKDLVFNHDNGSTGNKASLDTSRPPPPQSVIYGRRLDTQYSQPSVGPRNNNISPQGFLMPSSSASSYSGAPAALNTHIHGSQGALTTHHLGSQAVYNAPSGPQPPYNPLGSQFAFDQTGNGSGNFGHDYQAPQQHWQQQGQQQQQQQQQPPT